MDALHEAIKKIHARPDDASSSTLYELIRSLDSGERFDLNKLYQLNYSDFSLAMNILRQWRLDSYCYERGTLIKAAGDPSVKLDITALRYGRWQVPERV
ncbi:MAG TPA: hypothetical protein VMH26_04895 [Burkholderiales bacterium]|nr:hypothetical protein [Burkholderiales bacterium]